jgi:predicted ATPase
MEHRPLAVRFGQDVGVSILSFRSLALWVLGYPEAALTDTDHAVGHAREIGQAAGLMYVLNVTSLILALCGNHVAANTQCKELVALADEKGSAFWKAFGMLRQGYLVALTGKASDAVRVLTSGITAFRSTGATMWLPSYMSPLASAYAELGQFDDAWRCVGEAMTAAETTKERWWDAEINRVAGEIALKSPEAGPLKAEEYFERAVAVARQQQAKSWELRAAMSLARLWRDQGRVSEARELLAPVYGWFTEGFDTRDLKEAKALLEELNV